VMQELRHVQGAATQRQCLHAIREVTCGDGAHAGGASLSAGMGMAADLLGVAGGDRLPTRRGSRVPLSPRSSNNSANFPDLPRAPGSAPAGSGSAGHGEFSYDQEPRHIATAPTASHQRQEHSNPFVQGIVDLESPYKRNLDHETAEELENRGHDYEEAVDTASSVDTADHSAPVDGGGGGGAENPTSILASQYADQIAQNDSIVLALPALLVNLDSRQPLSAAELRLVARRAIELIARQTGFVDFPLKTGAPA